MTIFWSVLATWLVLGGCAALIEEIDAEWPKYILLAPYIAVITPTALLIKHIRATYIRSHYNIYRFGKNKNYICLKKSFVKELALPEMYCALYREGKEFKSMPHKGQLIKTYSDLEKIGYTRDYIEKLQNSNKDEN